MTSPEDELSFMSKDDGSECVRICNMCGEVISDPKGGNWLSTDERAAMKKVKKGMSKRKASLFIGVDMCKGWHKSNRGSYKKCATQYTNTMARLKRHATELGIEMSTKAKSNKRARKHEDPPAKKSRWESVKPLVQVDSETKRDADKDEPTPEPEKAESKTEPSPDDTVCGTIGLLHNNADPYQGAIVPKRVELPSGKMNLVYTNVLFATPYDFWYGSVVGICVDSGKVCFMGDRSVFDFAMAQRKMEMCVSYSWGTVVPAPCQYENFPLIAYTADDALGMQPCSSPILIDASKSEPKDLDILSMFPRTGGKRNTYILRNAVVQKSDLALLDTFPPTLTGSGEKKNPFVIEIGADDLFDKDRKRFTAAVMNRSDKARIIVTPFSLSGRHNVSIEELMSVLVVDYGVAVGDMISMCCSTGSELGLGNNVGTVTVGKRAHFMDLMLPYKKHSLQLVDGTSVVTESHPSCVVFA